MSDHLCHHLIRCAVTAEERAAAAEIYRDTPAMMFAMLTGPCTNPTNPPKETL